MKIFFFSLIFIVFITCQGKPSSRILPKKGHGRIIGGSNAFPGQFPFAAAIYTQTPEGRFFCSGTLLSDLWVLTAAQCVDGGTLFQVFLGSVHLRGDDTEQIEVATNSYVAHPDFNRETLENDLALIEFRMPIRFTNYIQPVESLPLSELPDFVTTSVFGWGQTSDADAGLSNELQWVAVYTITNAACSVIYGNQIDDKMICAEGDFNEGTCFGDIGSPLLQHYSTGYAVPVGIASFVSFNGCESTDPSGFTRVFPYNNWIRNVTGLEL